jgi:hypothetical protein
MQKICVARRVWRLKIEIELAHIVVLDIVIADAVEFRTLVVAFRQPDVEAWEEGVTELVVVR